MVFSFSNLLRPKEYRGEPVIMVQEKMDGIRVLIRKLTAGRFDAYTREGKTNLWPLLAQVPGMEQKFGQLVPEWTAFDCELHARKTQATDIKTLLLAHSEALEVTPFALPMYSGSDFRTERWEIVSGLILDMGFATPTTWMVGEPQPVSYSEWAKRASVAGIEGYVAKLGHYHGWYKIKPIKTVEVVVMGFTRSSSKTFGGGLKAFQVGLWVEGADAKMVEVASVGTGFDAKFRVSCEPREFIGKVMEVAYDSLAGQGKLKFPRFVSWRDDKLAHECTMEQINDVG